MLVVLFILFLAVAFSRIATGSHTINQILHGWVWGAVFFYIFIFNYDGAIKRLTNRMKDPKLSFMSLFWNPITKIYLVLVIINFSLMYYVLYYVQTPKIWDDNMALNCANYVPEIGPEWANMGYFLMSFGTLTS